MRPPEPSTPASRQHLDPNIPDSFSHLPLHWIVLNNNIEVAEQLLRQKDIDLNRRDEQGKTPLAIAAQKGFREIVEHLLSHEDLIPDLRDLDGRTPLIWAAGWSGSEDIVRLLLAREDVDCNAQCSQRSGGPGGPTGKLPRRLDRTGRHFSRSAVLGHFRTGALREDHGPHEVRHYYAVLIEGR